MDLENRAITVSNSDELFAALKNSTNIDTIYLASNADGYSLSTYRQVAPDHNVTITSLDSSHQANFKSISLQYATNLTFDNVSVGNDEVRGSAKVSKSDSISFTNVTFDGKGVGEWGVTDGAVYGSSGLSVRFSEDISIESSVFTNNGFAINIHESDNVKVLDTEITQFQGDGIRLSGNKDILIEDNWIHDPLGSRNDLNHDDLIQMWAVNENRPSENIIIRGNVLDTGDGSTTQSIFMRNEDVDRGNQGEDRYYQNIVIEDNVIINGHVHGISLGESNGVTIQNNTLVYNGFEENGSAPSIRVNTKSTDVTIQNNITGGINAPSDAVKDNNVFINYSNASADNYVGNIFVNAEFGGDQGLEGYQINPDSFAATRGVGAGITQFDPAPDQLTAVFIAKPSDGFEDTFVFNAGLTADKNGFLGEDNAVYLWDFGDGTTARGIAVTHKFDDINRYDVTLKVVSKSGEVDAFKASVVVDDPTVFNADFEDASAALDQSTYGLKTSSQAANFVHDDENGNVYQIGNGQNVDITRGQSEIYNLDQMYIAFDFKLGDSTSSGGQILGIYRSYSLSVTNNGGLLFTLSDVDGQNVRVQTEANVIDHEWHNIGLAYDVINNKTQILVDGVVVAEGDAAGLTKPHQSWGLQVGNYSWGNAAEGLIDNLKIEIDPFASDAKDDGGITDDVTDDDDIIEDVDDKDTGTDTGGNVGDDDGVIDEDLEVLYGTDGNDRFSYAVTYDLVYGEGGNDYIRGAEETHGGDGNDKLFTKTRVGGVLYGDDGDDILVGYQGDDYLVGGDGADNMRGAEGNDTLIVDNFDTWIQGGSGTDSVFFEGDLDARGKFFHSIEVIDMQDDEVSNLILSWVHLRSSEDRTMTVKADAGDTVTIDGGGYEKVTTENVVIDGEEFTHYNAKQSTWLDVDLFVSTDANVEIV